jgi:hypothetical protein
VFAREEEGAEGATRRALLELSIRPFSKRRESHEAILKPIEVADEAALIRAVIAAG